MNEIPGITRIDEEEQLTRVLEIAQKNLEKNQNAVKGLKDELHELLETYGAKDVEALSMWNNTVAMLEETKRDLMRSEKARKKPYFGRIDFKDPKQPQDEAYYVGRVGISGEAAEPIVIDWRAPVASVYYENNLGLCKYVVKNEGTFEIELKRKRTYEIAEDKLKDFFDSDVVANDELLTKYLAKSKKAVLGEIIATIQKEQNAIIRTSPKTNLIVQGVAGSGKTTVAMHRISYILYNYEADFRPEDFYIIGSNRILLNYITSVLPDLDVYGVSQMTMEQLFVRLLYEDWNPKVHHICEVDKKNSKDFIKGSYEWFHDLEQFCKAYECEQIPQKEVCLEKTGVVLMDETFIKNYLENNPKLSMQSKMLMLNEILLAKLENEMSGKYVSYTNAERKELQRTYRWYFGKDVWKGSIFEVYQEFLYGQEKRGKGICFTENAFDVYDLAALAYIYKRIKETDGIREASHVIIDEAQDFGMMAYAVLEYCLRDCTYTIMGDVSQNIHFGYGLNDWKELQDLMLTRTYDSFGLLKKSYRNTVEISNFATEILRHGNFSIYPVEPIIRHGNEVCMTECKDEADMLAQTQRQIENWQREGHETIAIICRDEEETARVSAYLRSKMSIVDSDLETTEFGNGVMVLPVEYTKGLEFDAVLIYHPSAKNYPAEDSYVKLLYVAATRALHELSILHLGDLTDLIGKPVSEEKRMKSLENEVRKEAKRYQKREVITKEKELQDALQGEKERAMRGYIGPKPIVVQKEKQKSVERKNPATNLDSVNTSSFRFGDIPDNSMLRPKGHSRIDNSIRMVRKTKKYIDFISSYGILRLTPIEEEMIRVQFLKGQMGQFEEGYWNCKPKKELAWTAKEGKNLIEVATAKIKIRIEKRTGALQFFDKDNKLLLSEKENLPRQIESGVKSQTWVYFDWAKKEKIYAKGVLVEDLELLNQKARYISFGGKKLRMPLVVSEYGYGIGVAAEKTVMCCAIPMYGPYVYTEGKDCIDYYFIYGGAYVRTMELYQKCSEIQ